MKGKNVKRILTTATAAAATLVLILAVNVSNTNDCTKLWNLKLGVGVNKYSFSSIGTGSNDKYMIQDAEWLYRDQKNPTLPAESKPLMLRDITKFIESCSLESNYGTTPDAVAYVVDTGLFVDNIDTLKAEGKLPAYYQYRPLDKYPKNGQAELQKLIDSGVDLSPVFDPEWYHRCIVRAWTAPAERYQEAFVKSLVSGIQGCATFDVDAYKEYNPDLYAIYGNDNHAYVVHYLTTGKNEGRICVYPQEEYQGYYDGVYGKPLPEDYR